MRPLRGVAACVAIQIGLLSGCHDEPPAETEVAIVARVDGSPILREEIERRAGWRLYRAELDAHLLLEREVERSVEERLLEDAARARGVDTASLLQQITEDVAPVSEADIDRYLEEHPADVSIEAARPRIRHYLEEKHRIERRQSFVAELRRAAKVEILLTPPARPRIELDLTGAPARGPRDAEVTLVQFTDLSREDSARSILDVARLEAEFEGKIRLVHRSLPAPRDELGLLTAQLAAAAADVERFWALRERIAASGGVPGRDALDSIARELGLEARLPELAADRETLRHVQDDLRRAREVGVRRAPTLFVNGRYFMGLGSFEDLRELVREEVRGREEGRDGAA